MKKCEISVEAMERHCIDIKMTQSSEHKRIAVVYVPPEGSRHYNTETMQEDSGRLESVDIAGGDFNWRASRGNSRDMSKDTQELPNPEPNFAGWPLQATRREKEMTQAWPWSLRAATPRSSKDLLTRLDWTSGRG